MKLFNEILAAILLIACACCFLYAMVEYAAFSHPDPIIHQYTYRIETDTLGCITPSARAEIDSIVTTIKHHEQTIKDRYDYVLEQRQYAEEYITIGGILITIILSVFGFFGYKSFKSIEEDAIAEAKKTAERKAEDTANDKATEVSRALNRKLSNELNKEQKQTLKKHKEVEIPNAVAEAVQKAFCEKVEDHVANIDTNIERISDLEDKVVSLQKQMEELVQTLPAKKRGRKPLSEMNGLTTDQITDIVNKNNSTTPDENSEA